MRHSYPDLQTTDSQYTKVSTRQPITYMQSKPFFELEAGGVGFMVKLIVKVYYCKISFEYKPFLGGWEREESYNAVDIGNTFLYKGRNKANVGAKKLNSDEDLFLVKNLKLRQAYAFKEALDQLILYRYQMMQSAPNNNF